MFPVSLILIILLWCWYMQRDNQTLLKIFLWAWGGRDPCGDLNVRTVRALMYHMVQLWSYSVHFIRCKAIADKRTGFSLETLKCTFNTCPYNLHSWSLCMCVMGSIQLCNRFLLQGLRSVFRHDDVSSFHQQLRSILFLYLFNVQFCHFSLYIMKIWKENAFLHG